MQSDMISLPPNVVLVQNPLALQALGIMRDKHTPPAEMRAQLANLTAAVLPKLAKDLEWYDRNIATPLELAVAKRHRRRVTLVPVLRAGLGMLDVAMRSFTDVRAGFIWLKRDEETAEAQRLAVNLPYGGLEHDHIILLDGMVATGGSTIMAVNILKEAGATDIRQLFVVAAPEGLAAVHRLHPDVKLYGPAVDECLDENKYIVPGLGDLGDRLYGT